MFEVNWKERKKTNEEASQLGMIRNEMESEDLGDREEVISLTPCSMLPLTNIFSFHLNHPQMINNRINIS